MSKLLWLLCFLFSFQLNLSAQVNVTFTGLAPKSSTLYVGIYDQENEFMGDKIHYVAEVRVKNSTLKWTCNDLAPGKYALTAYQDVNNNGKMDKGAFGAPKEPYGFSCNPVISFKAPTFKDCAFFYTGEPLDILINMK